MINKEALERFFRDYITLGQRLNVVDYWRILLYLDPKFKKELTRIDKELKKMKILEGGGKTPTHMTWIAVRLSGKNCTIKDIARWIREHKGSKHWGAKKELKRKIRARCVVKGKVILGGMNQIVKELKDVKPEDAECITKEHLIDFFLNFTSFGTGVDEIDYRIMKLYSDPSYKRSFPGISKELGINENWAHVEALRMALRLSGEDLDYTEVRNRITKARELKEGGKLGHGDRNIRVELGRRGMNLLFFEKVYKEISKAKRTTPIKGDILKKRLSGFFDAIAMWPEDLEEVIRVATADKEPARCQNCKSLLGLVVKKPEDIRMWGATVTKIVLVRCPVCLKRCYAKKKEVLEKIGEIEEEVEEVPIALPIEIEGLV